MTPYQQFQSDLSRLDQQRTIHRYLVTNATSALDLSDLLRAEFVQMVSALDHYVHELTLQRMLEIFDGTRPSTDAFKKYQVPMSIAPMLGAAGGTLVARSLFEQEVRERHSYLSFQQPDKIADAVRLFSTIELWKSIAADLKEDPASTKRKLALIVDRRNKIAHESDLRPDMPGERWAIDRGTVNSSRVFIEQVCVSMDKHLV